jgi:hypothetical protein
MIVTISLNLFFEMWKVNVAYRAGRFVIDIYLYLNSDNFSGRPPLDYKCSFFKQREIGKEMRG